MTIVDITSNLLPKIAARTSPNETIFLWPALVRTQLPHNDYALYSVIHIACWSLTLYALFHRSNCILEHSCIDYRLSMYAPLLSSSHEQHKSLLVNTSHERATCKCSVFSDLSTRCCFAMWSNKCLVPSITVTPHSLLRPNKIIVVFTVLHRTWFHPATYIILRLKKKKIFCHRTYT